MKFQQTLLSLFVIGTLSACGSSSSDTSSDTEPKTSLSGKAADGYLSNAKVCLDLNNNKMCDSDEPSAMTGAGGAFTLTGATQAQIDANPLLVEIIKDQTIDEDAPGVVLTQAYTLSAPAGYTFVSPLTTLVQNEVDNGSSVTEAVVAVQGKLGTTLSLNEDYIAGKKTGSSAEEFEKLHQVAQVTAKIISDNIGLLKETATTEDIDLDKLISLITNKVFDALATITTQVASTSGGDFDADAISKEIDKEHIALEPETLKDEVKQNEADNASTAADMSKLIQAGGINWFWSETEKTNFILEFGTLKLDGTTLSDIEYEINADGEKIVRTFEPEEGYRLLTSEGWVANDDTITGIKLVNDTTIIFEMATSALNETVTGTEVILDGLNVKAALKKTGGDGSWAETVSNTLNFPDGSKAYKLNFSQSDKASPYEFDLGNWCETDDVARWEALNSSCNGINRNGNYATTLASFEVASSVTPQHDDEYIASIMGIDNGDIVMQIVVGGTVGFYKRIWGGNDLVKLSSGTWQDLTVHGKVVREIVVPASVANMPHTWSSLDEDNNKFYLSVVSDFVRIVWADIDTDDGEYTFNSVASEYILENASRDNLPVLFTETLIAVDGSTETKVFTKAGQFTIDSAVGVYDMYFDEADTAIAVTISTGGTGSIDFGEGNIGTLVWSIADGGSLDFTETASDGGVFDWSIIMVEAFDDMPGKTALIEEVEVNEAGKTTVILNTFVRR